MTRTRTRKLQKLLLSDFPLINSVFLFMLPILTIFQKDKKAAGEEGQLQDDPWATYSSGWVEHTYQVPCDDDEDKVSGQSQWQWWSPSPSEKSDSETWSSRPRRWGAAPKNDNETSNCWQSWDSWNAQQQSKSWSSSHQWQ